MIGKWLSFVVLSLLPITANAEPISKQALSQYQYGSSNNQCAVMLSNSIRIEFSGVFANENDKVAFHELVIVSIPVSTSWDLQN